MATCFSFCTNIFDFHNPCPWFKRQRTCSQATREVFFDGKDMVMVPLSVFELDTSSFECLGQTANPAFCETLWNNIVELSLCLPGTEEDRKIHSTWWILVIHLPWYSHDILIFSWTKSCTSLTGIINHCRFCIIPSALHRILSISISWNQSLRLLSGKQAPGSKPPGSKPSSFIHHSVYTDHIGPPFRMMNFH